MVGIAKQHGCKVHIVNGTNDHVHMLLAAPTTACLANLMRFVKGSSSRWVHQEFPAKRSFGWQRGFAAFSVSRSRFRDVYRYNRTSKKSITKRCPSRRNLLPS